MYNFPRDQFPKQPANLQLETAEVIRSIIGYPIRGCQYEITVITSRKKTGGLPRTWFCALVAWCWWYWGYWSWTEAMAHHALKRWTNNWDCGVRGWIWWRSRDRYGGGAARRRCARLRSQLNLSLPLCDNCAIAGCYDTIFFEGFLLKAYRDNFQRDLSLKLVLEFILWMNEPLHFCHLCGSIHYKMSILIYISKMWV